jgi:hypothetical protein
MPLAIRTIDDRHKRVPLARVYRAAFVPNEPVRAIGGEARHIILGSQRIPGIALVLIGWLLGIIMLTGGFGTLPPLGSVGLAGPLGAAVMMTAYVLSLWFVAWLAGKLNRLFRHRAIADQIARAGHCPSCLEYIRDTPPATDGCIACPQCGAAWRANRLQAENPRNPAGPVVAHIGPEWWPGE